MAELTIRPTSEATRLAVLAKYHGYKKTRRIMALPEVPDYRKESELFTSPAPLPSAKDIDWRSGSAAMTTSYEELKRRQSSMLGYVPQKVETDIKVPGTEREITPIPYGSAVSASVIEQSQKEARKQELLMQMQAEKQKALRMGAEQVSKYPQTYEFAEEFGEKWAGIALPFTSEKFREAAGEYVMEHMDLRDIMSIPGGMLKEFSNIGRDIRVDPPKGMGGLAGVASQAIVFGAAGKLLGKAVSKISPKIEVFEPTEYFKTESASMLGWEGPSKSILSKTTFGIREGVETFPLKEFKAMIKAGEIKGFTTTVKGKMPAADFVELPVTKGGAQTVVRGDNLFGFEVKGFTALRESVPPASADDFLRVMKGKTPDKEIFGPKGIYKAGTADITAPIDTGMLGKGGAGASLKTAGKTSTAIDTGLATAIPLRQIKADFGFPFAFTGMEEKVLGSAKIVGVGRPGKMMELDVSIPLERVSGRDAFKVGFLEGAAQKTGLRYRERGRSPGGRMRQATATRAGEISLPRIAIGTKSRQRGRQLTAFGTRQRQRTGDILGGGTGIGYITTGGGGLLPPLFVPGAGKSRKGKGRKRKVGYREKFYPLLSGRQWLSFALGGKVPKKPRQAPIGLPGFGKGKKKRFKVSF